MDDENQQKGGDASERRVPDLFHKYRLPQDALESASTSSAAVMPIFFASGDEARSPAFGKKSAGW